MMQLARRRTKRARSHFSGYLDGQFLIAMPAMPDERFRRAVIYICAHTADGAMGLIINQRRDDITFPSLLGQLEIVKPGEEDVLPPEILSMDVNVGGPVETKRGFVLHSDDYRSNDSTLVVEDGVALTSTTDILKAMAAGRGPEHLILALGCSSWSAGQLDHELSTNSWLTCPADREILFETPLEHKYEAAMSRLGIDPLFLVSEAGHA